MKKPPVDVPRVDVFSTKGGVGKTTVAFRMAKALASSRQAPVLIVDADLAGTCIGDLLNRWVAWTKHLNLVQLVCGRPEDLPESERPVYQWQPSSSAKDPLRVDKAVEGPVILFCPSHAESEIGAGNDRHPVSHAVLHALVGHESSGGWVGHVIEHVIQETSTFLSHRLAAVVVDHGPGIGALQWAEMRSINQALEEVQETRSSRRTAAFVTSRDLVDLMAARAINERMTNDRLDALQRAAAWVLNRVPVGRPWRSELDRTLGESGIGPSSKDRWYDQAIPLKEDDTLSASYRQSDLGKLGFAPDHEIALVLRACGMSS